MKLKSIIFLLLFINNYAQTSTEKDEVFPIFPICELLPQSKLADYAGYSLKKGFNYALTDKKNDSVLIDADYKV